MIEGSVNRVKVRKCLYGVAAAVLACSDPPTRAEDPGSFRESNVWIQSFVRHNTSTPIQSTALTGAVAVTFLYDMPIGVTLSRFLVTVAPNLQGAEEEVCTFGVTQLSGGVVCVIDTAERRVKTGERRFPNGQWLIRGKMLNENANVIATAQAVVTLSNP